MPQTKEINKIIEEMPPDLKSQFQKIDQEFLAKSRERLNKENEESSKTLESLNSDSFQLRRDLLLMAGTIFGSSIALASGRTVNNFFIAGEIFLLLSIITGLITLGIYLKGKEWDYAFFAKYSLESYLLINKNKIEKFELEATENIIKDYEKLLKHNQRGLLHFLARKVSIEKWPTIFNTTFIVGTFLILVSIAPWAKNIETIIASIVSSVWNLPTVF